MADGAFINSVKTTCPYCGVGCGVIAERTGVSRDVVMRGDPDHPANFGRLCSKGLALGETLGQSERLLYPKMFGARASWEDATTHIAAEFSRIIDAHGPDAVAFYVSGQLLTEDYYVANKLMKGFIGSANIDTNSRLCMASSVAGHKRAFGADIVPGCYEDLDLADLVVFTGSNFAWCHPVLYQRVLAAKEARPDMRIVVIDPRRTATCDFADLHLPIRPGSDVPLFLGLLRALNEAGAADEAFVASHTRGAEDALAAAAGFDIAAVAAATGLAPSLVEEFFQRFLDAEKTVTVYSQGVNQASDGTDRVNAIINCHLLTGRIGKPGAGPFSITGQPNAMGGREVGGLANQLASHMALENAEDRDRVRRFWRAPTIAQKPGLKAVDLFDAIHKGDVKAVWIMATNPVVSMPNADYVREALRKCDLVVVSDVMAQTDTAACADILLPSTAWGEKKGMVTNSERRISRQRAFLSAPGEARDDWRQVCDVAQKMGFAHAFAYRGVDEIFREYASLCAYENEGTRGLDLGAVAALSADEYAAFTPQQWPAQAGDAMANDRAVDGVRPAKRLFADGGFFTKDRRAVFVPTTPKNRLPHDEKYPYTLNTGRIRDQWHTMTRTGLSPRLSRHIAEPFVEITPRDAADCKLTDADIAQLETPNGAMLARVVVTDRQQEGSVFAPMHWTDQFAGAGRVDALTTPAPDPVSGQPALKASRVSLSRFDASWFGFATFFYRGEDRSAAGRSAEKLMNADYWAAALFDAGDGKCGTGVRMELAGRHRENSAHCVDHFFDEVLTANYPESEVSRVMYSALGRSAYAVFYADRLVGLFFLDRTPVSVSRAWACAQMGNFFPGAERMAVLAGRPGGHAPDQGAIVCSCMNVGVNQIKNAIASGCSSVDAVSDETTAGSNCGSCRSEIRQLLREAVDA